MNLLNRLVMISIKFENKYNTHVRIDDILFELPYRIESIIEFSDIIIFHSSPNYTLDPNYMIDDFKKNGQISLYVIRKKDKKILWTMKEVDAVFAEIPEKKREEDFISKEHYLNYMSMFRNKKLLSVYIGEFRKLIDANNGNIISLMESR